MPTFAALAVELEREEDESWSTFVSAGSRFQNDRRLRDNQMTRFVIGILALPPASRL